MGDRVNAMRDYQEAVRLDETYSLAYFNAGNVYFHTRQFSQVFQCFREGAPRDYGCTHIFLLRLTFT